MRFKKTLIYLALATLSLSAAGLTLGRARGAAWIGLPLDLTVAIQLENDPTGSGLCAEADVFYADTRIDAARVQVSLDRVSAPEAQYLRIQSAVPVDEPVVTIYVRAGCVNKSTRRYVLLADYPTDNAAVATQNRAAEIVRPADVPMAVPPAPTTPPAAAPANTGNIPNSAPPANSPAPAPAPAPAAAPALAPAPTPAAAPAPAPKPASSAAQVRPARAPVVKPVEKPAQATKPVAPAGARLKLDPLENLTERIKTLESATTSPPAQEVMQDTARIQQLQGDVKALLAQAAKNQENLAVMRERLEKAETQQQPSLLTYLLLALLAASVTAIGVLWFLWRRRPVVESATQTAVPTSLSPTKPYEEPATEHVDLDDLSFEKSVTVVEARRTALLAFDEQSMLDMCQRAAFLQSVGRTDEAVALLENRIRANPKDCPLVYLQLLEALHQSARTAEYRVVRHAFMQSFNVNVPEMSSFQDKGKALEAYPGVLSRITQLWQTSKALDEITTCVIPGDHKGQVQRFDMAAFKELIMLHGLAIESQNPQKQKRPPVADSEHIQLDF